MKGSSLGYLIKEGARNIYANRMMSFASIGTLVACMLLIGASISLSINVNQVVGFLERQNKVVAFVADDISEEEIIQIDAKLALIDNLESPEFYSKEEILEMETEALGENAAAYEGLEGEENPFPATYIMTVKDLDKLEETVAQVEAVPGIYKVNAPDIVAEVILALKNAVTAGGYIIVGLLLVVSLVIIANTIKITVFNRRKEINIMKYVGATDAFIRLPFVVEGLLLGLISALVSFGLLWLGYDYIMNILSETSSAWIAQAYGSMLPFDTIALQMLGYFCAGGIGVGVIGCMVFVNKYLKV